MELKIVFGILLGATVGLAVGYFGQRAGGTCPLMCNPYGGAIFGAAIGALLAAALGPGRQSYTPSPHLVSIESTEAFEQNVLQAEGPVLVYFYRTRCPACRLQEPVVHAVADRFAQRAVVAQINEADVPGVFQRYGIDRIPALVVFKDGEPATRKTGYRSEEELAALLEQYLPPPGDSGQPLVDADG